MRPVTVKDFSIFIDSTKYITDAEKFGWSFIQKDVYNFEVEKKVNWRSPNGNPVLNQNLPVTQISYNDAIAYCNCAGVKLATYKEYWKAVSNDKNVIEAALTISPPLYSKATKLRNADYSRKYITKNNNIRHIVNYNNYYD